MHNGRHWHWHTIIIGLTDGSEDASWFELCHLDAAKTFFVVIVQRTPFALLHAQSEVLKETGGYTHKEWRLFQQQSGGQLHIFFHGFGSKTTY